MNHRLKRPRRYADTRLMKIRDENVDTAVMCLEKECLWIKNRVTTELESQVTSGNRFGRCYEVYIPCSADVDRPGIRRIILISCYGFH